MSRRPALDQGALAGATLTCSQTNAAATSPLWGSRRTTQVSDPRSLAINVLQQIERFERGELLQNVINRSTGY